MIKLFLFLTYIFIHPHSNRLQHQHASNTSSLVLVQQRIFFTQYESQMKRNDNQNHHYKLCILHFQFCLCMCGKINMAHMIWSVMRARLGVVNLQLSKSKKGSFSFLVSAPLFPLLYCPCTSGCTTAGRSKYSPNSPGIFAPSFYREMHQISSLLSKTDLWYPCGLK